MEAEEAVEAVEAEKAGRPGAGAVANRAPRDTSCWAPKMHAHANMHSGYKVRAYMEGAASIHSGAGGAVGTSTIEPAESTAD